MNLRKDMKQHLKGPCAHMVDMLAFKVRKGNLPKALKGFSGFRGSGYLHIHTYIYIYMIIRTC